MMSKIDGFNVNISDIKYKIRHDLEQLREFVMASESFLVEEKEKFSDWEEKETENLPDEDKEYDYGWNLDTHWKLAEIFPRIQRSSLFISAMSLHESRLNSLCTLFTDKESPTDIKLSDLKGGSIKRALLFLQKVAKLQIDTNTRTWKSICTYQIIRNYLVHANDRSISKESDIKAINKCAGSDGGVTLDERNRIKLDPTFLGQVLNVIERFFNQIFVAIEETVDIRKSSDPS